MELIPTQWQPIIETSVYQLQNQHPEAYQELQSAADTVGISIHLLIYSIAATAFPQLSQHELLTLITLAQQRDRTSLNSLLADIPLNL